MLSGLNHITIAVNNLEQSFSFYVELLGMKPHAKWHRGAYLSLGELWFCLSCDSSCPSKDYSHLAFDVAAADFPLVRDKLLSAGVGVWKQNQSEGDSLYILDPDGHKLEIHVGGLDERLASLKLKPYAGLVLY
ncbi:fosfomycin resistance glutathione transferase [Thalassomonas viridans]|uniref:Fosfomycin resistance glutathione transferase n=1 Tax=Thalassomonas viridans TaxID=137584 RepID=A0AAE9Z777_9GAMM|nr:fosfomycin resistance glutathione transferase [Thalassomonas viridans]WDE08036.1 fosfomycin resistance glutathione transferase [Thalassomonas viridans]